MRKLFWLVVCVCLSTTFVSAQATPHFASKGCELPGLIGYRAECGTLTIPEDYANPASHLIELPVLVIRSRSTTPKPDPVVYLAGGPGGSTIANAVSLFRQWFTPFAATRDVIFFDQRGTGYAAPALYCTEITDYIRGKLVKYLTPAEETQASIDLVQTCHQRLASSVDTSAYTSAASAQDVQALRQALGYAEWNLIGVSYGARLALTTLRDAPDGIRSVILDSVYAPQFNLYTELLPNSERALSELFAACEADTACNKAYPRLATVFWDLYERLNARPVEVNVNAQWGSFTLTLTGDRLYDWVFNWLYGRDDIEFVPQRLYALYEGDYNDATLLRSGIEQEIESAYIATGVYYAVQCSEEIRFTTPAEIGALPAAYPRLTSYIDRNAAFNARHFDLCSTWHTRTLDPRENEPVRSPIPALLLGGQFDPITPPHWAEATAALLENSYVYTVPGVGHGVLRSSECSLEMSLVFLDDPLQEPDTGCIANAPALQFKIPQTVSQ
jgi:pimeloyl-ACP methyl ester carboxylesterase